MNWLAHLLLSKPDIEYQLGNLLADPLKGRAWEGASGSFKEGLAMHKAIDVYTDSHPIIAESKSRLGERGYLKGVVIDVLYDHFLSNLWQQYSEVTLLGFMTAFDSKSVLTSQAYPTDARRFVHRLVASGNLKNYRTFDGFVSTLRRLDKRLSPRISKRDSTERYVENVQSNYGALRDDFEKFFPELVTFFKTHQLGSEAENYLI